MDLSAIFLLMVTLAPAQAIGPAEALAAMNGARAAHGLPAMRANVQLFTAAQPLANGIAATGIVTHADFSGRVQRSGYRWSAVAENAALARSVGECVSLWLNSPGHRANILGRYVDCGVGMTVDRRGRVALVATFGTPAGGTRDGPPQVAEAPALLPESPTLGTDAPSVLLPVVPAPVVVRAEYPRAQPRCPGLFRLLFGRR